MQVTDLGFVLLIALTSTLLAAGLGVFLLRRQKNLQQGQVTDTAYLRFCGNEKQRGQLPSSIVLYSSPLRIGRHDFFEIPLDDIRISRFHALISFDRTSEQFYIRDQESMSGTFINGRKLEPSQVIGLNHGDIIAFGLVEYQFFDDLHQIAPANLPTAPVEHYGGMGTARDIDTEETPTNDQCSTSDSSK